MTASGEAAAHEAPADHVAWFWLVRAYPPTRLAAFTFLSPVFGVTAGGLMLGEPFTPSLATALLLIGFGIYFLNRPNTSEPPPANAERY